MRKDQAAIVRKCLTDDEPVFALRGQDRCAVPALVAYLDAAKAAGCSEQFLEEILDIIEEFTVHQENEFTKYPD